MHEIENLIRVKRDELKAGLALLARTVDRRFGEEGILSFDGDCLHIEVGGGEYAVAADGFWDCQVRVPSEFLLRLAKFLPDTDIIELRVTGDKFWLNRFGLNCSVQDPWQKAVDLPIGVTCEQAEKILSGASQEELVSSGLGKVHASSLRHPMEAVVGAVALLKGFGIEEPDIIHLIETKTGQSFDDILRKMLDGEEQEAAPG